MVKSKKRLINIIVEKRIEKEEAFSPKVAEALHEYANLIEEFNSRAAGESTNTGHRTSANSIEEINMSNGCIIRVIAGSFDP